MADELKENINKRIDELTKQVLESQQSLSEGIANSRIKWHRRPLSAFPTNFICEENEFGIELNFSLSSGVYATSLLRELTALKNTRN